MHPAAFKRIPTHLTCSLPHCGTSGHTYSGEWKDGQRNGKGTIRWPDGNKYMFGVAKFERDKPLDKAGYLRAKTVSPTRSRSVTVLHCWTLWRFPDCHCQQHIPACILSDRASLHLARSKLAVRARSLCVACPGYPASS